MENDNLIFGTLGTILGGILTYVGQVLHSKYLHRRQNELDIKYLALELKRTLVGVESIFAQLKSEKESYLVDKQIRYLLSSDFYQEKYRFFLNFSEKDQREYFLANLLLVHGLQSLEYNLISCLSLEDDQQKKLCQKRYIIEKRKELVSNISKIQGFLEEIDN